MFIKEIRPYHFRNLLDEKFSFTQGLNVVIGSNAQGKTALLEAIYFLAHTKSFRAQSSEELCVKEDSTRCFSVFGDLVSLHGAYELGISCEGGRKQVFYNKNKVPALGEYIGKATCVCFTPEELSLVRGGPALRRSFLDKHLVDLQPALFKTLSNYKRALNSKQKLLKSEEVKKEDLDPWNEILAAEGIIITQARHSFLSQLEKKAELVTDHLSHHKEKLSLIPKYTYGEHLELPAVRALLHQHREKEIYARSALYGPHRDDFKVFLSDNDAASFASQGQVRSIVIALMLSVVTLVEEKLLESPIVLLDDVISELDEKRAEALLQAVLHGNRQVIISGTDISLQPFVRKAEGTLLAMSSGRRI